MRFYVLIGALVGMVSTCPSSMSPQARGRIEAGYRLRACLKNYGKDVCLPANNVFCRSIGLEDNCGVDELWADPAYYSPVR